MACDASSARAGTQMPLSCYVLSCDVMWWHVTRARRELARARAAGALRAGAHDRRHAVRRRARRRRSGRAGRQLGALRRLRRRRARRVRLLRLNRNPQPKSCARSIPSSRAQCDSYRSRSLGFLVTRPRRARERRWLRRGGFVRKKRREEPCDRMRHHARSKYGRRPRVRSDATRTLRSRRDTHTHT